MAPTTFKIDGVLARHEWRQTHRWESIEQARHELHRARRNELGFQMSWHLNSWGRGGRKREWHAEVAWVEMWEPDPKWVEPESSMRRCIMICRASNGRPVRIFSDGRRHAASVDDCEGTMRYNGPEGPGIRADAQRRSDEYNQRARDERERIQALKDDARALLDDAGFEGIEIKSGLSSSSQVVLDLEDFLALCRAAHQARGFVLDA